MGRFVKGDVVATHFPYSDLSDSKKPPALVVATLKGDDVILCQVTKRAIGDDYSVPIEDTGFDRSPGIDYAGGGSRVYPVARAEPEPWCSEGGFLGRNRLSLKEITGP